ncbi:MAG: DNA replication/repair protein RecF [Lachnospiraceae bacterium]|jgi:DNA replication and repair protein RecF|nr:DNA replication/repair protein RecF [Lachnospiraceae bacterium]
MIIKRLQLKDFRNYPSLDLSFSDGINILYGDNAQGKTNVLEAVYMLATTKSHRGARDKEVVRFGCEEGHIRAEIFRDDATWRVDMHLQSRRSKGIAIDGQRLKKASDLVGRIPTVFFSPEDLAIVKEGPAERRRFIDMELCQLDASYLYNLSRYNRVIQQRNKLLKDIYEHPEQKPLLEVHDRQLSVYGREIIRFRKIFLDQVAEIIAPIHDKLTGGKEKLQLAYEPHVTEDKLEDALAAARDRDVILKQTTVGPHRDDFAFYVTREDTGSDKVDIRRFGSQGQQRTASLSLKLAEIEIVKKSKKENPILLLDDVLSELDGGRQRALLSEIGGIQTIITCTGYDEFVESRLTIDRLLHVTDGKIEEVKE